MLPTRRDLRFQLPPSCAALWHARGPWVTHFANAMSLSFPEGERYFIHSVRLFREAVTDRALRDAVTAFIGQEAMHSREHEDYNRALRAQVPLPVEDLEAALARFFALLKTRLPAAAQLSVTIAQEHFTAIFAERLLEEPALIDGADDRLAALWRWHALEEIEHKAVAYDVYQAGVGRGASAYALRCAGMLATTAGFLVMVLWCQRQLVAADPRIGPGEGLWSFVQFFAVA